jgi:AraC-like DNA-binding protein
MVGIVIAPEFAHEVIGIAAEDLVDTSAEPPALIVRKLERFLEAMSTLSTEDALDCWTGVVNRELGGTTNQQQPEAVAANLIRASGGRIRVSRLAEELTISHRQLRRRFQGRVGMSPKSYSRLVRLTRTVEASDRDGTPDWVGLAADSDYSDQAHFIRECVDLTGLSPARLHKRRHGMSEKFNTSPAL